MKVERNGKREIILIMVVALEMGLGLFGRKMAKNLKKRFIQKVALIAEKNIRLAI